MKIKFPCDFQFHTFPFDKHECNLSFYERLHDSKTVILNPPNKITHGNQKCCQNKSSSLILTSQKSPFKIEIQINPSSFIYNGQVSVASIKLKLQRETIELLMGSFFVPTGMFSILSMMSYVINPEAVSSKGSEIFLKKNVHNIWKNRKKISTQKYLHSFKYFFYSRFQEEWVCLSQCV